jgi:hypothetical protein
LSEPASKLEREKMIYVNGREIPSEMDFLTSQQILGAAGFVPEQLAFTYRMTRHLTTTVK